MEDLRHLFGLGAHWPHAGVVDLSDDGAAASAQDLDDGSGSAAGDGWPGQALQDFGLLRPGLLTSAGFIATGSDLPATGLANAAISVDPTLTITVASSPFTVIANFEGSFPSGFLANYESEVTTAVQDLETQIVNPITLDIAFDASSAVALGASADYLVPVSYATLYDALEAADTTSAVQAAAFAALPASDPTDGAGQFLITDAQAEALKIPIGTVSGDVGTVTLASNLSYSPSQTSVGAGSYDAIGVLEHEITEVMGRDDLAGEVLTSTPDYSILDLYNYTAANGGTADAPGSAAGTPDEPFETGYNASAQSYFSYNGSTVTLPYDSPALVADGEDIADWSPTVPNDAFDGSASPGEVLNLSTTDLQEMNVIGFALACYVRGTRIATPRGAVAIETLRPGDDVLTASGAARQIRWLGHRAIDCTAHPDPASVWPVLVREDAFAPGVPVADLWLSPEHAVAIDGALVPVERLCNGRTVLQVRRPEVEYWHLELGSHDLVLAEGLAAESYLDTGNRGGFVEGPAFAAAHPGHPVAHWSQTCLPMACDGPALHRAKAALLAQADVLGHVVTAENDLRLRADGAEIAAIGLAENRVAFLLPAGCGTILLASRSFIPAHVLPGSGDRRRLGVCVGRLQLDGTTIPLDAPEMFGEGWHDAEAWNGAPAHRWTTGRARLPPMTRLVVLDLAGPGHYWAPLAANLVSLFG
jgi:hypothetical protein